MDGELILNFYLELFWVAYLGEGHCFNISIGERDLLL